LYSQRFTQDYRYLIYEQKPDYGKKFNPHYILLDIIMAYYRLPQDPYFWTENTCFHFRQIYEN